MASQSSQSRYKEEKKISVAEALRMVNDPQHKEFMWDVDMDSGFDHNNDAAESWVEIGGAIFIADVPTKEFNDEATRHRAAWVKDHVTAYEFFGRFKPGFVGTSLHEMPEGSSPSAGAA